MRVAEKVTIRLPEVSYLYGSQDVFDSSSGFPKFEQAAVRSSSVHPTHKGLLIYSHYGHISNDLTVTLI